MREIATMTSGWRARTLTAASQSEELEGVLEGADLFGRLLGAGLERLAVAVDPDHRHLQLHARVDVVVAAGRHVDPALLGADAPLALLEMRGIGLVGAHLLRGDDEVEVQAEMAPRLPQELVVD